MILLDTNVLIDAFDRPSPHCAWARRTIADAVAAEGAAINAVSLAELCVLDVPVAAAEPCARAYLAYPRTPQGGFWQGLPGGSSAGFLHRRPCPSHGLDCGDCRRRPVLDLFSQGPTQDPVDLSADRISPADRASPVDQEHHRKSSTSIRSLRDEHQCRSVRGQTASKRNELAVGR